MVENEELTDVGVDDLEDTGSADSSKATGQNSRSSSKSKALKASKFVLAMRTGDVVLVNCGRECAWQKVALMG